MSAIEIVLFAANFYITREFQYLIPHPFVFQKSDAAPKDIVFLLAINKFRFMIPLRRRAEEPPPPDKQLSDVGKALPVLGIWIPKDIPNIRALSLMLGWKPEPDSELATINPNACQEACGSHCP